MTSKRNSDANIKNREVKIGSKSIIINFASFFTCANICMDVRRCLTHTTDGHTRRYVLPHIHFPLFLKPPVGKTDRVAYNPSAQIFLSQNPVRNPFNHVGFLSVVS